MTETVYLNKKAIHTFIDRALKEDLGDGDHSSLAAIPEKTDVKATLIIKDDGILAGMTLTEMIFDRVDPAIKFNVSLKDGDPINFGQTGFSVQGCARSILSAERIVLNCLQRMSGIATKTHSMVDMIKGTKARLLDTRKTTPNFRMAEKWAVKIGGGTNHRVGLFDMIMLKDNHIDFAGGIENAIKSTRSYLKRTGKDLKIEIEVRSVEEVEEVLNIGGVDIIMLDNMIPSMMKDAVELIRGRYLTEASGGITEQTIREVAETGVDFISVGALTHSYRSLDMSLKAI